MYKRGLSLAMTEVKRLQENVCIPYFIGGYKKGSKP